MLAKAQSEYVFETIDPAVVPQEKSEPKQALIVVMAALLGGMMGMLFVIVHNFVRSYSHSTPKINDK
ncbi:GNVR domain-containing protein [Marinobacter mobilis]|uniref:GNVR domain-containing protein n=1 Tax=Marinobacter mobilis TaxID=488533 RepID=UPI0035C77CB0